MAFCRFFIRIESMVVRPERSFNFSSFVRMFRVLLLLWRTSLCVHSTPGNIDFNVLAFLFLFLIIFYFSSAGNVLDFNVTRKLRLMSEIKRIMIVFVVKIVQWMLSAQGVFNNF